MDIPDEGLAPERGEEKKETAVQESRPTPPPVEPSPGQPAPPQKAEVVVYRTPEREGFGLKKILLIVVALVVLVLLAAYFTIGVEQSSPYAGATYPWTTTYEVLFPDGKQVYIGTTSIMALSYQDEVIIDVDGDREKMVVGEERLISERRAVIKALGIPVADTNYQMYVKFLEVQGKSIKFYLTIKTSQQVQQFLIERILPPEIQARPA
jgi:hypothetical protein